jgi:thymidylate kinase
MEPADRGAQETAAPPSATWHPFLAGAFAALDEAGVGWCLLRPPGHPAAPTGDVDLLVRAADRRAAARTLSARGLARLPDAGSPDAFFLDYDPARDCWIFLHLTSELSFGRHLELRTGAAAECLGRRVRDGGIWRLAADDEFWVTLLHALLDKGRVGARHRDRLAVLAGSAQATGPVAAAFAAHAPAGWSPGRVLGSARDGRWADLDALARPLGTRWRRTAPGDAAAARLRLLGRLARGLANPWRRRGLSVAVLGPDGAGKSTLVSAVEQTFFLPSRSFYMEVRDAELAAVVRLRVPGLTFLAYLVLLWRRLAAARWHQARGETVLFDRYNYDVLADARRPGGLRQRLARWVHARVFPRAGLALVLDVPGPVMFARKGERAPDDLEAERRRLLGLRERLGNVEILDATQPVDQVRRDATGRIWARYAARWSGPGPAVRRA